MNGLLGSWEARKRSRLVYGGSNYVVLVLPSPLQ